MVSQLHRSPFHTTYFPTIRINVTYLDAFEAFLEVIIISIIITALQSFVAPWSLYQFSYPTHSQ
jgi:hypothetical protein